MRLTILGFWVLAAMAASCAQAQNANKLSVADFEKRMTTTAEKIVLDVRTASEFQGGHIDGAVQINFYKNDFRQQIEKLDKTKPVFVYCAAGGRSGSATSILAEAGFKQVFDLQGGMNAWRGAGKKVVK